MGFTIKFYDNFVGFNDEHEWYWSYILSIASFVLSTVTAVFLGIQAHQTNQRNANSYLTFLNIDFSLKNTDFEATLNEKHPNKFILKNFYPFYRIENFSGNFAYDVRCKFLTPNGTQHKQYFPIIKGNELSEKRRAVIYQNKEIVPIGDIRRIKDNLALDPDYLDKQYSSEVWNKSASFKLFYKDYLKREYILDITYTIQPDPENGNRMLKQIAYKLMLDNKPIVPFIKEEEDKFWDF
jgi:hypothetical protein